MGKWRPTVDRILNVLSDGKPRTSRQVAEDTGLKRTSIWRPLHECWKKGLILRTEEPIFESFETFRGRRGFSKNTRSYYFYVMRRGKTESLQFDGKRFVAYDEKYLDVRGFRGESKSKRILNFLESNSDRAFYSTEVFKALEDKGVKIGDVMNTVRRYNRFVYVRGYRSDNRQTPFKEGYLLTWIDHDEPREEVIEEAIQRTDKALANKSSTNPVIERIHAIRDRILASSKLIEIVSMTYLQNELGCTEYEIENAVSRALQLYEDLRETKIFKVYRYFYHSSMSVEDLKAAIIMKENYIRIVKGRNNRVGHNWEAIPEWFVDKFTTGAKFWTQKHRTTNMDPRRITIHLVKSVGGRRNNAEVDRVWEVTPGIFAQPITYVLSCKWGLVRKKDVEDFLDVLRWSKDFGVDTPDGRQVKQGVIGVFAGSAFKANEKVRLKDDTEINLASYTSRMNIQLLKASDFNQKLRERGLIKGITVQKICKYARDEKEVREMLDRIWERPSYGNEILTETVTKNKDVYNFENMLEAIK